MRATGLLVAVVLAVAIASNWRAAATVPGPVAVTVAPPTAAPLPPPVPSASAEVPATAEVDGTEDRLALPDGAFVANLNGATGALSLAKAWGSRPWSPIARVERSDAGVEWYVHEDGTRSTTEMKWRPDLARFDAMVRLALPQAETPPVRPIRR